MVEPKSEGNADPSACAKCGEHVTVVRGEWGTGSVCDDCAQEILPVMRQALLAAQHALTMLAEEAGLGPLHMSSARVARRMVTEALTAAEARHV